MVDRCRAYYNQITQGEGGTDFAVCLMGTFPSSPAENPLTRSQNTPTYKNTPTDASPHIQTHTHRQHERSVSP